MVGWARLTVLFLFLCSLLFGEDSLSDIRAHFILEDDVQVEQILQHAPQTMAVQKLALEFYAMRGRDAELLSMFRKLIEDDPQLIQDRNLLKKVCWGVLESGKHSHTPQTRLLSFLAAYLTQDGPAVLALEQALFDQNPKIRAVAATLTEHYPDRRIQKALVAALEQEKIQEVRLGLIDAVGRLGTKEAKMALKRALSDQNIPQEERGRVIAAYCALTEEVGQKELEKLKDHPNSGMRLLGCALVLHTRQRDQAELLTPLLFDTNYHVRAAALFLFHWSGKSVWQEYLHDSHPQVQVIAGWSALREGSQRGVDFFQKKLQKVRGEERQLLASALASAGVHGIPLIEEIIIQENDPIVLAHLALGLVGQRTSLPLAKKALMQALRTKKRRWAWKKKGGLSVISSNSKRIESHQEDQFAWEDLMVRMELIEALHLAGGQEAFELMRALLKESSWGAVLGGSALILAHGPEEGAEVIEQLLNDSDPDVSLQAAFILGQFKKDPKAIFALQSHFKCATRRKKELILEAIGQIGSSESIPFLVEVLSDSHQHLRLIAASSLILCCKS